MSTAAMPAHEADVLIIGAGPVGLSLAIALAKRGVATTVLDRKIALDTHSRAIALFPRTLEIFRELGVLDDLLARGERSSHLRLRRASTRETLIDFDFNALDATTRCNFVLAIPQDRTEAVLLEAARAAGRSRIMFRASFKHFDASADFVDVTYQDADGEQRAIRARYLVGADGAHSAVREQLGWVLEGKTYATRAMLADVEVSEEADTADGWLAEPDRPQLLMSIRYGPRTWRLIEQGVPDTLTEADQPARAREMTETLFGPGSWRSTLWTSVYRKHERTSPRFREGRVLLIGDAAHLNSPAGGQGLNTGVRDAHNLAWKLDLALRGGDAEALLASYEIEQQDAFRNEVAPLTDMAERLQTSPQWVRKVAFKALPIAKRLGAMEKAAAKHSMLFIDYGASPLLVDEDELVGRRIPDLQTPHGRIHDLIGRQGLLLCRGGAIDADQIRRPAGPMEIAVQPMPRALDDDGYGHASIVYVRPDQVVGLVTKHGAPLDEARLRAAAGFSARAPHLLRDRQPAQAPAASVSLDQQEMHHVS